MSDFVIIEKENIKNITNTIKKVANINEDMSLNEISIIASEISNNYPKEGDYIPVDTIAKGYTYTVDSISGAAYGFALNENGYYESQNKGIPSSYALCRINLNVLEECDINFNIINYGQFKYDYGIIGRLDTSLTLSTSSDSGKTQQVYLAQHSSNVLTLTYKQVSVGNHFIDVKYIKNASGNSGNDSIQFKLLQETETLIDSQYYPILETVEKNLKSSNIKKDVEIFGIKGEYEGDFTTEDNLAENYIYEYTNDRITSLGKGAFAFSPIESIDLPKVRYIDINSFYNCSSLQNVNLPEAYDIAHVFEGCNSLVSISLPKVWKMDAGSFDNCYSLVSADFSSLLRIYGGNFNNCYNLKALILRGSGYCDVYNFSTTSLTFTNCYYMHGETELIYNPNGLRGYVYVPATLKEAYETSQSWIEAGVQFRALEEYTIDGTTTGELDPNKI